MLSHRHLRCKAGSVSLRHAAALRGDATGDRGCGMSKPRRESCAVLSAQPRSQSVCSPACVRPAAPLDGLGLPFLLQPQPWGLLPRVQVLASHLYFKHTAPTASFSISFCLGFRKCLIVLDRRPDHRQEWCGTQSLPGFRSAPLKILVINLDQGICSELWKNSSCITLKCNLCLK